MLCLWATPSISRWYYLCKAISNNCNPVWSSNQFTGLWLILICKLTWKIPDFSHITRVILYMWNSVALFVWGCLCTHAYECVGMGVYTKSEEDTGRLYHCPPYYLEAGSLTILEAHCLATLASWWALGRCLSPARSTGITGTGSRARIFTVSTELTEPALLTCLFCFMTKSHSVVLSGLVLMVILLPPSQECWNFRCVTMPSLKFLNRHHTRHLKHINMYLLGFVYNLFLVLSV